MPGDIARRFGDNPILIPADVAATREDFIVESLLNPGVFRHDGRVGLVLRVCERPPQTEGLLTFPVLDPKSADGIRLVTFDYEDKRLVATDPRLVFYDGEAYLTTLSHLRLAWSEDGHRFEVEPKPMMIGDGPLESFGIEDCRVGYLDGEYLLTYSAVSPAGVGVGLATTRDWKDFKRHGMMLAPTNKDCGIFEQKIDGEYVAIHRPSGAGIGGNYIWLARSPDLVHWGRHECILRPRRTAWDCQRIGAGAAPILTEAGWLEIYHGADHQMRYCLGAVLLDRHRPGKVLARSEHPIMEPLEAYEKMGFFGNVVFTNGHLVDGDTITMYYGAADSVICGAEFSIREILESLGVGAQ